jgi:hypothetical protein
MLILKVLTTNSSPVKLKSIKLNFYPINTSVQLCLHHSQGGQKKLEWRSPLQLRETGKIHSVTLQGAEGGFTIPQRGESVKRAN